MAEYTELLKYLVGAIPPLLVMGWKWWKDRQKEQVSSHNDFLVRIENIHSQMLKYKEELLTLVVENKNLKSINEELNDTIKNLEKIISEIKGGK